VVKLAPMTSVRVLISLTVGGIGAAAGFTHTHQAAYNAGQHGWLAWADAVVIELMVVVAGLQLGTAKTRRRQIIAGTVMGLAFLTQMGSQVSEAPRTPAGWLFAALPALGCLVVAEFALTGLKRPAPAEVPADPEPAWREVAEREDRDVIEPEPFPEIEAAPVPQQPTASWGTNGWGQKSPAQAWGQR